MTVQILKWKPRTGQSSFPMHVTYRGKRYSYQFQLGKRAAATKHAEMEQTKGKIAVILEYMGEFVIYTRGSYFKGVTSRKWSFQR